MTEQRTVECQDCGYRWESSASSPRCAKSECGRSRNVEPVADDLDGEGGGDDPRDEQDDARLDRDDEQDDEVLDSEDAEVEHNSEPSDVDPEQDEDSGTGGGYTPAFESKTVRTTDGEDHTPTAPTSTASDEDDEQDDEVEDDEEQPGPDLDPDELPELDPEQLQPGFAASFGVIASQRGEHWKLDEEESETLAQAWTPVINHYAPYLFRQYTEVGMAAIVTFGVIGPKYMQDRKIQQRRQKAAQDTASPVEDEEDEDQTTLDALDLDAEQDSQTTNADSSLGAYANV